MSQDVFNPLSFDFGLGGLFVIRLIPSRELSQSLPQRNLWRETEIALEGGGIGIGGGDVAGLHGDELFVGFEVEVLGEDTGANQFFLEDGHEIEEVLGLAATDVINGIRWDGETVVALLAFRGTLHHADDALDNVVDIGQVASAVAVVVDLDGLALQELIGKAEVGHVGTTCGAIDREEAQARGGDVIELRIAVGEKLVALLGGCIKGYGIIHTVVGAKGDFLVAAIDGARRSID